MNGVYNKQVNVANAFAPSVLKVCMSVKSSALVHAFIRFTPSVGLTIKYQPINPSVRYAEVLSQVQTDF